MKILKIFGVVVGIHVFALILIFANPGCSSSSKPTPAPIDTLARADSSPAGVSLPPMGVTFDPNAPATAGSSRGYPPTRPNTPAASTLVAPPVTNVTPAVRYEVKAGDSLWSIANKNKLTTTELAAANDLKTNVVLKPGQKLLIPNKAAAPATVATTGKAGPAANTAKAPATTPAASAAANGGMKHTVKPGESLSTIARQYGVTVRELGAANNITDPAKVPAGMVLTIPGWLPGGGTTKGSTKSGKAPDSAATPATTPKPVFNILDSAPTPPPSSEAPPVIKVDESPMGPMPKK